MIVVRDKSLNPKIEISNFIDVITDDNAIAFRTFDNDSYVKTFHLTNIHSGLTKQDNQYYYFQHDIVNTPRRPSRESIYSYKVYPITNDIAQRIINKEYVCIWEIFFNSLVNYQKIYILVKDYNVRTYQYNCHIEDDILTIPYNISPSHIKDEQTIEEFISTHNKQYPRGSEKLDISIWYLRQLKLIELDVE